MIDIQDFPAILPRADAADNRPLRVMFVITSMHVGGAETLLCNLIRRMDRQRFAPELCCLKERGELGDQLACEILVHHDLLRRKYDLSILPRLARLMRKRRTDVVVTVGAGDKMFWGRLAARTAGVPVVVSAIHSTSWPDEITWLNRRLTPLTDSFVAVARPHAQHLVDSERLPGKRVRVIPNGVNTEKYCPIESSQTLREELGIPRSPPLAGIVAVLRPEKNHEMFLRVASQIRQEVPDAHFLVIGDGTRRCELKTLSAQLGLAHCVHFVGKRPDVPELLNLLDVFVLTSRMEANPVSILEALSCGKPVVATRVGSIPETVIDGQCGYLVEPDDDAEMVRRVAELLLDPAQARRFGAAGRQHVVENWSVDRMVAGYEELLESLYRRKTAVR